MTSPPPHPSSFLASLTGSRSYLDEEIPFEEPQPIPPLPPGMPPDPPFVPNEDQAKALDQIMAWRFSPSSPRFLKLCGPGGSGKTALLKRLRVLLAGSRVAWSAMTGKAVVRMREAAGIPGKTFHATVYHPPREVDLPEEEKVDLDFAYVRRDVKSCLLTIDEASMAGPKIKVDLERGPFEKILLVGDHFQLPPVLSKQEEEARGGDYSIFEGVEGPILTRIMRTQGAVLQAATTIREEKRIPTVDADFGGSIYHYEVAIDPNDAVDRAVRMYLTAHAAGEDVVLVTWRNAPRLEMNQMIRAKLGLPPGVPAVGEAMVARKNHYKTGIMNGDIVKVVEWLEGGPMLAGVATKYIRVLTVLGVEAKLLTLATNFEGQLPYVGLAVWKKAIAEAGCEEPVPLTWSQCLTAHLAQGSEWKHVITVLPGDLSHPHFGKSTRLADGGTAPFSMRFTYTAVARARERADLIVSR